jgi:hypothetical protein
MQIVGINSSGDLSSCSLTTSSSSLSLHQSTEDPRSICQSRRNKSGLRVPAEPPPRLPPILLPVRSYRGPKRKAQRTKEADPPVATQTPPPLSQRQTSTLPRHCRSNRTPFLSAKSSYPGLQGPDLGLKVASHPPRRRKGARAGQGRGARGPGLSLPAS